MKTFTFKVACVRGYLYLTIRALDLAAAVLQVMLDGHYRSEITRI